LYDQLEGAEEELVIGDSLRNVGADHILPLLLLQRPAHPVLKASHHLRQLPPEGLPILLPHSLHPRFQLHYVIAGSSHELVIELEGVCLEADVVDVVGLVEHHDAVVGLRELLQHPCGDLGVEQVEVVEDYYLGFLDGLPCGEVGALAALSTPGTHILHRQHAVFVTRG
jgi:hypothetical protein